MIFFTFIVLLGIIFRIYIILTRNIFIDEISYTEIALGKSFKDIIFINHWIKDHGILYYIFLKPFTFFTYKIELLRFTNLLIYVTTCFILIYFLLKIFKSKLIITLVLVYYSFHHYFLFLQSWISPFNLVSLLSIFSLLILLKITVKKNNYLYDFLIFIIVTVLAFYSDYSFFYTVPFYFLITLYLLLKDRNKLLKIIISYQIILIFIIPGIFQFIKNIPLIKIINQHEIIYGNFLDYLIFIINMLFFKINKIISLLILTFIFLFVFLKHKKNQSLIFIFWLFFATFIIDIIILYITNSYFFVILQERSFWFFYFYFIIFFSIFLISIKNNLNLKIKLIKNAIIFLLFLLPFFNYFNKIMNPGDIREEVKYNQIIKEVNNNKNVTLIIIANEYFYYPLTNYYYGNIFNKKKTKPHIKIFEPYLSEETYRKIKTYLINDRNKKIIIVFFNIDQDINSFYQLKNDFPEKELKFIKLFYDIKKLIS